MKASMKGDECWEISSWNQQSSRFRCLELERAASFEVADDRTLVQSRAVNVKTGSTLCADQILVGPLTLCWICRTFCAIRSLFSLIPSSTATMPS
jgi:hypothetical protein